MIYKQIFYTLGKNTITYKTEFSGDFPITMRDYKVVALLNVQYDDLWRDPLEVTIEPKPLQFVMHE